MEFGNSCYDDTNYQFTRSSNKEFCALETISNRCFLLEVLFVRNVSFVITKIDAAKGARQSS